MNIKFDSLGAPLIINFPVSNIPSILVKIIDKETQKGLLLESQWKYYVSDYVKVGFKAMISSDGLCLITNFVNGSAVVVDSVKNLEVIVRRVVFIFLNTTNQVRTIFSLTPIEALDILENGNSSLIDVGISHNIYYFSDGRILSHWHTSSIYGGFLFDSKETYKAYDKEDFNAIKDKFPKF